MRLIVGLFRGDAGYNFASIMSFASEEDRAYFATQDPAHEELKRFLAGKLVKGILVLDFASGTVDGAVDCVEC